MVDDPTAKRGLGSWTRYLRTLGITTSLVLLVLFFTAYGHLAEESRQYDFLSPGNLQTMASHVVVIALGAIGMTMIIVSGGIDLSVGSSISLSMVVTAWCIVRGVPLSIAAVAGVATGALAGLVNGALITGFRLLPFIVTLGMMSIARGLSKLLATSKPINIPDEALSSTWLGLLTLNPHLGSRPPLAGGPQLPGWLLVAPSVWLTLVAAVFMTLILGQTVFGRHIFAIGSNESTARLCGVPVSRVKILIYTLSGLFTGLAGVILCSRQSQGDPTAEIGRELDVIAAVVIGGGSLSGGEGSIFGSLVGAAIMIVLRTGLQMMNAPRPVQEIFIGGIIIVAVIFDQLQHRRKA